jgi:hypothetical protein
MSSTTTATASGLAAGAWLGELASALQGKWGQLAVAASGEQRQPKLGGGEMTGNKAAAKEAEEVGRCGAAMSDATLYLLLDRFAPN